MKRPKISRRAETRPDAAHPRPLHLVDHALPNTGFDTRTQTLERSRPVDWLLMRRSEAVAIAVYFQILFQGLRAVGTIGPYPAIVLIRLQYLGQNLAAAGRCRRGLVVAYQLVPAIRRHAVLIAQKQFTPCFFVQAASTSFCASLREVSPSMPRESSPCLSAACSSRVLRCRGTSTIVESTIGPPVI